ncbi:PREDICTED: uncharacterized protein LOC109466268 isoform X1 [Branchiostoma belcheri]|uniref:Uncharacterized protein LOC109466268 isoform X1 n=1 Tax=Branchiostoma belcheri TaxID=7741 RepID=A0A6P4YB88_BRABE|nr:PREDICTED: uncharacterized protein LOC109466268 isoform X1 [Branchiostoma belcheri]
MSKFSIVVVFLLAATLCREVQGQDNEGVPQALDDLLERVALLETQIFGSGLATVTLKIENSLDPDFESAEYQVSVPVGNSVFQMMVAATKEFDDFTFGATYFSEYGGHFINSINGLAGNTDDKTFWSFENGKGVAFDRGVDLISVHANDDVIVFRFASWATGHP